MDKNTKITIAISVAILTIFLGVLAFKGGSKGDNNSDLAATSTDATTTVSIEKQSFETGLPKASTIALNKTEGLSVVDQLADDNVAFSGATFADDTWVAVYEDKNGEPSNLLGVGLFFGGVTEGLSPIMRKTIAGSKYYVTLIKDNGDRVFDINADRPIAGSPVVSFVAK